MAEYTGNALYLKFGSTVLSADFRNFDQSEEIGLVDATAGADTNRTYLTTVKDGKATAEMVHQASGTALWTALAPGTSGTLEWGPEGTASTKPKHTVTAIVMDRKKVVPYEDIVVITAEFQFSGAVTDSVY